MTASHLSLGKQSIFSNLRISFDTKIPGIVISEKLMQSLQDSFTKQICSAMSALILQVKGICNLESFVLKNGIQSNL